MERLKKTVVMFGISITLTSQNFDEVIHPVWLNSYIQKGCNLLFLVEYVPQSQNDLPLCLTEKQQEMLQPRLEQLRKNLPALFISLPGDEKQYGGCLAAGRGFIHVSSEGNLEPCPFAPYLDLNIRETSLKESLRSPFLKNIRESHHLLSEANGGCTLWENRDWVQDQLAHKLARPA
jgi:MoaA/NifB/PqqE/SkfB family radical SAM enzyme